MVTTLSTVKTKVFVHLGALCSLYTKENFNSALLPWEEINSSHELFVTSNFVLDSFFTELARISGYSFAADLAKKILESDKLQILRPNQDNELEALEFLKKYSSQPKICFADCISVVLMRVHKISETFPFEGDSIIETYRPWLDSSSRVSFPEKLRGNGMREQLFIDTGSFYARYVERDGCHKKAIEIWEAIETRKELCSTSNFILEELVDLLSKVAGKVYAANKVKDILTSSKFEILRPNVQDELKAVSYFKKYSSKKISFTDCVSFALMDKHKIKQAFSFDNDFINPGGFSLFP